MLTSSHPLTQCGMHRSRLSFHEPAARPCGHGSRMRLGGLAHARTRYGDAYGLFEERERLLNETEAGGDGGVDRHPAPSTRLANVWIVEPGGVHSRSATTET